VKYIRFIVPVFVLLAVFVTITLAQDNALPNDPFVNPDANACFAGGSWEGKCGDDLEMWRAGWYLIRWEKRIISTDQIPDQYKWVLPPVDNDDDEDISPTPIKPPR
jgi:hypothetical protein